MEIKQVSDFNIIKNLLVNFDDEFTKGLLPRIGNVDEYVKKIIKYSENLICVDDSFILGFIFFYCNDFERKSSYVSQLCVNSEYRNSGIGTKLITECKRVAKSLGMKKIELEVNKENLNAISFYKKNGFCIEKDCNQFNSYIMELEI